MSMWYGLGEWHPEGMPHVAKIARKPRGIGMEMICGRS